ncbi:hypothetical protein AGMMS50293_06150 [Spirochaetia bacterium]|nr:hypothetical protein AGMMS50293_06150 [Spirochaetia bacterium]
MSSYIQILVFVTIGVVLLWFGYTLLIGQLAGIRLGWQTRPRHKRPRKGVGVPGDSQVCPVCSARLNKGELVSSQAFPSLTGGRDRLMYIRGCAYCLGGSRPRKCPVCGVSLRGKDILIARMFERPHRRSHVHVLGCSHCKKAGSLLK